MILIAARDPPPLPKPVFSDGNSPMPMALHTVQTIEKRRSTRQEHSTCGLETARAEFKVDFRE